MNAMNETPDEGDSESIGVVSQGVVNPIVAIHDIQGAGAASPLEGQVVETAGVVTSVLPGLGGFFMQTPDADVDADVATSEGLFVFLGDAFPAPAVGDMISIAGEADEFFGKTQLRNIDALSVDGSGTELPTASVVSFPVASLADLESVEGMLTVIPNTLYVTEYFNLDRFGQLTLSSDGPGNAPGTDGRLDQFTQFNAPDAAGFAAHQAAIERRSIILDDGSSSQNPAVIRYGGGTDPLSAANPLRGGDTAQGVRGVLDYAFGDYRIQPADEAFEAPADFESANPRTAAPEDVGGFKVASLNVLNYFTTLDVSGNPGSGPNGLGPRGADNAEEFARQTDKLVKAVIDMDADVYGLLELENEFQTDQNGDGLVAIDFLVDQLNGVAGAGTYASVDPGRGFVDVGDAISVGFIYRATTTAIAIDTSVEILDDSVAAGLGFSEQIFDGSRSNRASLAATFTELATGEDVTVAVNHFKSKGSVNPGDGNQNANDGAGNNNAIRLLAAQALDAWLDGDPTGSGDGDVVILGDLNSYLREDPIAFLEGAGYQSLIGPEDHSFVFDGQFGTLDYAFVSASLANSLTGVTEWHINADEPDAFDYNLDFGRDPTLFDGSTPFRSSDHDPLIFGLDLQRGAPEANSHLEFDLSSRAQPGLAIAELHEGGADQADSGDESLLLDQIFRRSKLDLDRDIDGDSGVQIVDVHGFVFNGEAQFPDHIAPVSRKDARRADLGADLDADDVIEQRVVGRRAENRDAFGVSMAVNARGEGRDGGYGEADAPMDGARAIDDSELLFFDLALDGLTGVGVSFAIDVIAGAQAGAAPSEAGVTVDYWAAAADGFDLIASETLVVEEGHVESLGAAEAFDAVSLRAADAGAYFRVESLEIDAVYEGLFA